MKQEFAHALSGKPEGTKVTNKKLLGYRIRTMGNFIYVTGSYAEFNKWIKLKVETDLFWVIEEHLSPLQVTSYILYKNKDIAEEHLEEIKNASKNY
jgi:hypothetical protein